MIASKKAEMCRPARKEWNIFKRMAEKEGLDVLKLSGKAIGESNLRYLGDLEKRRKRGFLVVVHGGGVEITDAMERAGVKPRFRDGVRITDGFTMEIVERELEKINVRMTETLRDCGLSVAPFLLGVFRGCTVFPRERNGIVTNVNHGEVACALLERKIAVLSPMGTDYSGTMLNFNADGAAAMAAIALHAGRLIMATDKDGIISEGKVIRKISILELEMLGERGVVDGGMAEKAKACIRAAKAGTRPFIINGNDRRVLAMALAGNPCGTEVLPVAAEKQAKPHV
jgi:acetylglutamate kinase